MLVNENYKVFYSNRDLTLQFQRLGRLRLGEFAYISSDALKLLHNKCTLHLAARIPFHYAGSCLPLLQLKVIWDDVGKYIGFCFVRLRCECFCKHVLSQPRPLQLMHQNRCDRPGTVQPESGLLSYESETRHSRASMIFGSWSWWSKVPGQLPTCRIARIEDKSGPLEHAT